MQQETEEFNTALYDVRGRCIGRWRMGYLPEWDQVIAMYPLDEPPTHHNGGNTEWRQP